MGLADEIEQEIRQAAERTPWLLDLRVGFEQVGGETPQGSPEHVALIHKILMAHLEVTEAHREAILRLAREIEDLNTRIGDLDKE